MDETQNYYAQKLNMKLIIAGSRSIHSYKLIDRAIKFAGIDIDQITEVVSGCAPGIDSLAIKWAENHDIKVKKFPADWKNIKTKPCKIKQNKYGKYNALAGLNRNKDMQKYADALLAIWDGVSMGTSHMIECMQELDKKYWVYEL